MKNFLIFITAIISIKVNSYTNCDALDYHKIWHVVADKFDFNLHITNTTWDFGTTRIDGHITQSEIENLVSQGECFPEESWIDRISFNRMWSDLNGKKQIQRFIGSIDWNHNDGTFTLSGWYCNEEQIVEGWCNNTGLRWNAVENKN